MENTAINWTDHTFNYWQGCVEIDRECMNCYARVFLDERYKKGLWGKSGNRPRLSEAARQAPYGWNRRAQANKKQEFVFCASNSDLMEVHPTIPHEWRDDCLNTIRQTPWLTWQLLSKRPENFSVFIDDPLPNAWLGTTIGHAGSKAEARLKALRETPVAPGCVRFVSAEPLLEDISEMDFSGIGWIIAGGESGRGKGIRSFHLEHAMKLYQRCKRDRIPFWFKQIGQRTVAAGELLDLVSSLHDTFQVPDRYKAMCRVRQRPQPAKVVL